MKNKIIILGAVLIGVGIILYNIAMMFLGYDFMSLFNTSGTFEEKSIVLESENKDIVIDDISSNIVIGVSNDDKIYINYTEREKEYYEIEDGQDLIIEKVEDYNWLERLFYISLGSSDVEVLLPKDYKGDLFIESVNSDITVSDLSSDEIEIFVTNGDIVIKNSDSEKTKLENINGEITLENSSLKEVSAKTVNGEIEIQDLVSDEMDFETLNGEISGNILGDKNEYNVSSSTVNGSNNLEDINMSDREKSMEANTVNGEINIEFAE